MGKGLYIGGTRAYSGKNMLSAGIGLRLRKEGLSIGYMKPVGVTPVEKEGRTVDEDAVFVQEVLDLDQPARLVTPVIVTQDFRVNAFAGRYTDYLPEIKSAYDTLGEGRDLMIVCGAGNTLSGKYCRLDGIRLVHEMGLKALIIDRLHNDVNYDELMYIKDQLGEQLLGVVLNDIPTYFVDEIENVFRPYLERNGVKVIGIIPQDPLLASIRAYELAEGLGGRMVSARNRAGGVVENFLIGTMQVENFMNYFQRRPNTAVIAGGDRADLQLVAIEGRCPCLVLTGNILPNDIILSRAEALDVPIVLVRQDTYSVAKKMEGLLSRQKLRDIMKIRQCAQLVADSLDFVALRAGLGV
ncbi:MAG: phosphotransacetylase family protein [Desulfovibrio sp.]|jgi:BioD-like phosphotransacetylase family protein|nr:phosphotransacetylase family protein [Desulfovibrio sp.]